MITVRAKRVNYSKLPSSPYCTYYLITGPKLKGEVCLWSLLAWKINKSNLLPLPLTYDGSQPREKRVYPDDGSVTVGEHNSELENSKTSSSSDNTKPACDVRRYTINNNCTVEWGSSQDEIWQSRGETSLRWWHSVKLIEIRSNLTNLPYCGARVKCDSEICLQFKLTHESMHADADTNYHGHRFKLKTYVFVIAPNYSVYLAGKGMNILPKKRQVILYSGGGVLRWEKMQKSNCGRFVEVWMVDLSYFRFANMRRAGCGYGLHLSCVCRSGL